MKSTSLPHDLPDSVVDSIRTRQCILLLGQRYLRDEHGENRLFANFRDTLAEREKTKPDTDTDPYSWWLLDNRNLPARERCILPVDKAISPPDSVASCLRLPWRAVFTSAFDGTLRRLLELPGARKVSSIWTPEFGALSTGSEITLGRLFGSIERHEHANEAPPQNYHGLRQRRTQATAILLRVRELLPPRGAILIDGWDPRSDWLRPRDLAPALQNFVKDQVAIFGVEAEAEELLFDDEDFADLLHSGIAVIRRSALSEVVSDLFAEGALTRDLYDAVVSSDIRYLLRSAQPDARAGVPTEKDLTAVGFARSEWRRIMSGFVPLLELEYSKPLPDSAEARYQLFRSFSAVGPQEAATFPWLRALAFRRPVLDEILSKCMGLCGKANPENHVVILYGQSGAGKTVLAFQLALELRCKGLPVLLYSQSLAPLGREKVDLFCETVSKSSRAPIFLIYDGTRSDSEYIDLAAYLTSSGRKCVVIGTCYPDQHQADGEPGTAKELRAHGRTIAVQVPVSLRPAERDALLRHINCFVPGPQQQFSLLLKSDIANFFAVIYRLLPETHPGLEAGIVAEIVHGTDRIRKRIESDESDEPKIAGATELEWKFRQLFGDSLRHLGQETKVEVGEGAKPPADDEAMRLVHVVMLGTAANLPIPQGLALRFVGHDLAVYRAIGDANITTEIRIGDDEWGLCGRHALEAQIWLSHRLPLHRDRVALLREVLLCLSRHEVSDTVGRSVGLEFGVRLLQAYGPDGRCSMPGHYFELAGVITDLRGRYISLHPRFFLVQSHLIREAVMGAVRRATRPGGPSRRGVDGSSSEEMPPVGDWLEHLREAEQGLDVAIDVVKNNASEVWLSRAARRMLATLATERACVFGSKLGIRRCRPTRELLLEGAQREAGRYFEEARDSWREAVAYDDTSRHAVDAACWICGERFNMGFGAEDVESEAGVLAEWTEAVDRYMEMDLAPAQLDKRDEREAALSRALQDPARFEAVVGRMSRRGSNAVHTLVARDIATRRGAGRALEYLDETCPDLIVSDRHLVVLYMRLWWRVQTEFDSYFPHERMCLAFGEQQWLRLQELTSSRLACAGEETHPTTRFLRACALVHLGDALGAGRLLEELERSGAGGFRRSRSLVLAADGKGSPVTYSAEYQGRRRGSRFLAWCDDLGANLFFIPNDFRLSDPQPGTSLGEFHLSIQFRGLLAEPTYRYRPSGREQRQ